MNKYILVALVVSAVLFFIVSYLAEKKRMIKVLEKEEKHG